MAKVLKRDVQKAEREYANSLMQWGENNLATVRALGKWQDLKAQWDKQKEGSK